MEDKKDKIIMFCGGCMEEKNLKNIKQVKIVRVNFPTFISYNVTCRKCGYPFPIYKNI